MTTSDGSRKPIEQNRSDESPDLPTQASEAQPPSAPAESASQVGGAVAQSGGQATNVNVAVTAPNVVVVQARSGESLFIRAVWFIFVGWWAAYLWAMLAWFLNLTIVGLPIGIMMLNRLPAVATLRRTERHMSADVSAGSVVVSETGPEQYAWWIRGIFFVLAGWWLSLIWIHLAYFLMLTLVGIPVAFIMFDYVAAVTTLRRLR